VDLCTFCVTNRSSVTALFFRTCISCRISISVGDFILFGILGWVRLLRILEWFWGVWMVEWEGALWGELERDPEQGLVGGGGGVT
jgi:hypothetical protein